MACDLEIEEELLDGGAKTIAGVDEAGRGPLAGPVVAAAVVLPRWYEHSGLDDSKKLSASRRNAIYEELISEEGVSWAVGIAEVEEIGRMNILRATGVAMERAVSELKVCVDVCIIDGLEVREFPYRQVAVVKGDAKSLSVAAASVIAKVERDRMMIEYDRQYPEYGFRKHKGYGTRAHLECLRRHGPCPIHRQTFRPVAQLSFSFGESDG
ncbi:MAG: ribonuclease HII [Verrucomicrobiota bacterium]